MPLHFRPATQDDCSHIAILLDAASRGVAARLWATLAAPGQSWAEVGRERIRTKTDSTTHYRHWLVAEHDRRIVGALCGLSLPHPAPAFTLTDYPADIRPMIALEAAASGTWNLQVAAIFPEFRNRGFGTQLVIKAESLARASGATRLSLLVESSNQTAYQLYLRAGFTDWQRHPVVSLDSNKPAGDHILMVKKLA